MRPLALTRKAEYDVAVMTDVRIPMRDGVCLAADVYRPVLNGTMVETPLPVLLERTPYVESVFGPQLNDPGEFESGDAARRAGSCRCRPR